MIVLKKIVLSVIILSGLYSQNIYDVIRPFWGFNHSQIISNSIGGATVASSYITPGLTSNPANLAATPFAYFQTNLSNAEFSNNSSNISKTGFNGIDFVQPIPVYRGSLVLSAGAHKSSDYMFSYQDQTNDYLLDYSEEGRLTSYHIGAGLEFAQGFYIGADLKFLKGSDEMMVHYESDSTDYYRPKYSGTSLTLGILHAISKNIQYGISLDMPTSLTVREKFVYSNHILPENSYSGESNYKVTKPITVHMGAAYLSNLLNLFYELEWTDWKSLKYSSNETYNNSSDLPASVFINQEIQENFNQTFSHHVGTAIRVPFFPLHIFAGYQYTPFPEKNGHYGDDVRENYSLGFSFAVKKNIAIQGSLNTYSWTFAGLNENFNKFSLGVSIYDIPGI